MNYGVVRITFSFKYKKKNFFGSDFFLPLFILLHLNTYEDSFPACSLLAFSGEFKRCSPQLGREPVIVAFAGKRSLDSVSAGTQPANRKE